VALLLGHTHLLLGAGRRLAWMKAAKRGWWMVKLQSQAAAATATAIWRFG
jgi:hypothetical protein